jgi:transposase InsO family protein
MPTFHSESDRNAIDQVKIIDGIGITHRRTVYHHPEGNSYIERFHRSLKEEEVGLAEYRNLEEARESSGRYL